MEPEYNIWQLDWPVAVSGTRASGSVITSKSCDMIVALPDFDPRNKVCARVPYPQQHQTYGWEKVLLADLHKSYRPHVRAAAKRLLAGGGAEYEHSFPADPDYEEQVGAGEFTTMDAIWVETCLDA